MFSRITSSGAPQQAVSSDEAVPSSSTRRNASSGVNERLLPLLPPRPDNLLADARNFVRRDNSNKLQDLLREQPRLLTTPFDNSETLLTEAAGAGKHKAVQAILTQAVLASDIAVEDVVNHRNATGGSALTQAIQHGHKDVAKALLKHDAVASSNPALADAINRGRLDVAQSLVKLGPQNARLTSTDQSLHEAHRAAVWGDANMLQALLHQNPQLLTMRFGNNDTLLTAAAAAGEDSSVQAILAHTLFNRPADFAAVLNHRNDKGDSALMQAVRTGALDVVTSLLTYDQIEANEPNRRGQAPLHLAAMQRNPEFAVRLLDHASIRANPLDRDRNTPLHLAVARGHSDTAIKVADHEKSAPDEVNRAGKSPLALAIDSRDLLVIDALLKRPTGVNPDRTDSRGQTLLWQEVTDWRSNLSLGGPNAELRPWSLILGKLAASPDVNANSRNKDGETPLTYLSKLSCPWDISAHNEFNQWRNNTVKAMLDGSRRGAGRLDPDAANADGKTPYQVALAAKNTALIEIFEADAEARRSRG